MSVAKMEIGKWYVCWTKQPTTDGLVWTGIKDGLLGMPLLCVSAGSDLGDFHGWDHSGKGKNACFHRTWVQEIPPPADPKQPVSSMHKLGNNPAPQSAGHPWFVGQQVVVAGHPCSSPIPWVREMDQYRGTAQFISKIAPDYVNLTACVDKSGCPFAFHHLWISPHPIQKPAPSNPTPPAAPASICKCNILYGCSCGAMIKEMVAKGKVKDPVFGFWTEKK